MGQEGERSLTVRNEGDCRLTEPERGRGRCAALSVLKIRHWQCRAARPPREVFGPEHAGDVNRRRSPELRRGNGGVPVRETSGGGRNLSYPPFKIATEFFPPARTSNPDVFFPITNL
eukprot:60945-Hanusia_phi.AAC.2